MKKGLVMIIGFLLVTGSILAQSNNEASTIPSTTTQTEYTIDESVYVNPMAPADEIFYFKYNAEYFSAKCQGNCTNCPYAQKCSYSNKGSNCETAKPTVCQFRPNSEEAATMDARLQKSIQVSQIK